MLDNFLIGVKILYNANFMYKEIDIFNTLLIDIDYHTYKEDLHQEGKSSQIKILHKHGNYLVWATRENILGVEVIKDGTHTHTFMKVGLGFSEHFISLY